MKNIIITLTLLSTLDLYASGKGDDYGFFQEINEKNLTKLTKTDNNTNPTSSISLRKQILKNSYTKENLEKDIESLKNNELKILENNETETLVNKEPKILKKITTSFNLADLK